MNTPPPPPLNRLLAYGCLATPHVFLFDKEIWWRIGGSGLVAILLSPFFFFALNYLAFLVGYDPQPERNVRRSR